MLIGELEHRFHRLPALVLAFAIAQKFFFHQFANIGVQRKTASLHLGGELVGNGDCDLHP